MIKEVKYNGYTATPSDYECPDGDLAGVIGFVPEDGAMKPLLPPKPVLTLSYDKTVVYIHETINFRHYIIKDAANKLSWTGEDEGKLMTVLRSFGNIEIYQVNSIGNTLLVLTSDGIHYFLWKGNEQIGYIYLGTDMPECSISFGLRAEMKRTDEFTISFSIHENSIFSEFSDDTATNITNQVLAKVNKFIAEESTEKGKFIYPFLIRYAYRLYDGTLTRHSAPILMICSSDIAPRVFWFHLSGKDDTYKSATLRVVSPLHTLDYAVTSNTSLLQNWKDIIKSVDIFISKPIYTYDQNGKCTRFQNGGVDLSGYSVCRHVNQAASTSTYPLRYQYNEFGKLYAFTFTPNELSLRPGGVLHTPQRSVDAVKEDIRNCSQFYFLESIKIDALQTTRTAIEVKEDYLQSLVTREVMTDDYDSHDRLFARYSFAYNQRLNLTGMKKQLFEGFGAYSLFNFSDGYVYNWADTGSTLLDVKESVVCYVFIKHDGRDIVVRGQYGTLGFMSPILFFYYPNVNAYKAIINRSSYGLGDCYEIPLEQHNFLNGAFYFGGWDDLSVKTNTVPTISTLEQRIVDIPNKIYTSDINNPFYFPILGINTVGTGTILGICSAVKALSQGQFGQFPLYAFTTEGVWALEVSETGTYTARQPVTRDVCINADSITQIDNAVLFAADRGIMLISGSNSMCISDVLNSDDPFSLPTFQCGEDLIYKAEFSIDTFDYLPFKEFLVDCRMIYDYTHQRIIVYNRGCLYAYVYSLKSKQWGMMESNISGGVNSYPEALAMTWHDGLVDFAQSDETIGLRGLIITRPLKLENPDVLKTVDTVIQRGFFRKGHVATALYGSRDLYNWHLIFSSKDHYLRGFRGTPYKYYRVALICKLDKDESVFGCTVQYTPRLLNQPR